MPHFGLMDESALPQEAAALLRARLHLRGGRRRLSQAKHAAGIAALYDGLCSGMKWYILVTRASALIPLQAGVDMCTDGELFSSLARAGVLDNPQGFDRLQTLLDQLLAGQEPDFDPHAVLALMEHWLTRLGVMPFDEGALPPEDPNTY